MSDSQRVVTALGGNALQNPDHSGKYVQQIEAVRGTVEILAELVESGHELILTHGNGPQIGRIYRQNLETADVTPPMPLFVCGAQTQGFIGNMIQTAFMSEFDHRGMRRRCVALVTPVIVDENDEAFENPTKPIGPFLSNKQASELRNDAGTEIREFDQGYRQVVPSPEPVNIYGVKSVEQVLGHGNVPVIAGGGGVPVVETASGFEGVNAVIDKDLAGARLAEKVDADIYLILTDVPKVALNYGEPDQTDLESVTTDEMRGYIDEDHFARGSMYEKVDAVCRFVENGSDRRAIITSLDLAKQALEGEAGTHIYSSD